MPLWSNQDAASNSVLFSGALVNLAPNTVNRDNMFGNVTPSAFVTDQTVGVFGVDVTEVAVGAGPVTQYIVTFPGSGYTANATVTVSGGGGASATANAQANTLGRIQQVNIMVAGSGYTTNPAVAIAAPTAISFNANTAVNSGTDFITIASNVLQNGDRVRYLVAAGNTALTNLANNTQYYVVQASGSGVKLSLTSGGSPIDLTAGVTETGHSLTGETATAVSVVGGATNKGVAHAGWNLRRVGSGGRAGRVHYETLVAMGSMTNSTDAEDSVLPDA